MLGHLFINYFYSVSNSMLAAKKSCDRIIFTLLFYSSKINP